MASYWDQSPGQLFWTEVPRWTPPTPLDPPTVTDIRIWYSKWWQMDISHLLRCTKSKTTDPLLWYFTLRFVVTLFDYPKFYTLTAFQIYWYVKTVLFEDASINRICNTICWNCRASFLGYWRAFFGDRKSLMIECWNCLWAAFNLKKYVSACGCLGYSKVYKTYRNAYRLQPHFWPSLSAYRLMLLNCRFLN